MSPAEERRYSELLVLQGQLYRVEETCKRLIDTRLSVYDNALLTRTESMIDFVGSQVMAYRERVQREATERVG